MQINGLELRNFRCFQNASFDFDPHFNLLIGINGSGKTSLLHAIVAAIAVPLLVLEQASFEPLRDSANTRSQLREINGRLRLSKCYPVQLIATGFLDNAFVTWRATRESAESSGIDHGFPDIYSVYGHALNEEGGADALLPMAAFYSAHRKWLISGVSPESSIKTVDSRTSGYADWYNASADMSGLEKWIIGKSLERLEFVEKRSDGSDEASVSVDELSLVNRAVSEALPGSSGLRFDMRYRKLVIDWIDRDPTPFEELSDGQRGICALVADIARRMCLLNPQLGSRVTQDTPGIVVIDELDIHLHPEWQRRVVSVLRQTFPLVQFFAATHSPQIIGELATPNVLVLDPKGQAHHPERSYGLDSSEVLEEVMGSPSQNIGVAEFLSKIRHALEDDDLSVAETYIEELKRKVGSIPDLVQLQSELDSLRLLGGSED